MNEFEITKFTPEKSKQIALARLDIVHQWLEFRKKSKNKLQADYDFVKLHNTSNGYLFEILGKISRGSLHRWNSILNGTEDYEKLLPQQYLYRFIEKDNNVNYAIFTNKKYSRKSMNINNAIKYFMKNYVQQNCKKGTAKNYNTLFIHIILPFFREKEISKIDMNDIKNFYLYCSNQNLKPRRIKNSLALLNQLLKYFRQLGYIKNNPNFQVKRLTDKNQFSINRIIFEV